MVLILWKEDRLPYFFGAAFVFFRSAQSLPEKKKLILISPNNYFLMTIDCPSFISVAVLKYHDKKELRGENRFTSAYISRLQSVMKKSKQELQTAGHLCPQS